MKYLVLVFKGGKFKVHFIKFRFFKTNLLLIGFFSSNRLKSVQIRKKRKLSAVISFKSLLQDESIFEKERFKISSKRLEKNPKTLKLAGSKHQTSMLQKRF